MGRRIDGSVCGGNEVKLAWGFWYDMRCGSCGSGMMDRCVACGHQPRRIFRARMAFKDGLLCV